MKIKDCLYINLDHRTDKCLHIVDQLKNCPYIITRIPGVVCDEYENFRVHSYIKPGSKAHKGVMGCWCAHFNALDFLYSVQLLNQEYALIFEDDCVIDNKFWSYVHHLEPPADSDIVFFDSGKKGCLDPLKCLDHNKKLYKTYTSYPIFVGTHCYAVKLKSLSKILNILNNTLVYKDIDGFLFGHNEIITYNYQTNLIGINFNLQSDRL